METLEHSKLPYTHRNGRTFKEFVSSYLEETTKQAVNWIEIIFKQRCFTHKGSNILRSPYCNLNSDWEGLLQIITTKGSKIVIKFGDQKTTFDAIESSQEKIISLVTELLKQETEKRAISTQRYYNEQLGLSLI
ncbi:hypothetical protein [Vibrio sp. D431a]|uniref:hypothetical protein n=1 Tax=Vibrio sp. D431a TaxID=2837388 RepID=UPI0025526116|nr:hypothetical protein [Vibrio sp. D431a]MDK9793334.1 hypothetical protein [Vibrio sp. D431a]